MKKIAIKINSKAEYDALMKHFKDKCWKWCTGTIPTEEPYKRQTDITYHDDIMHNADGALDYEVISFSTFSALTGILAEPEEVIVQCGTMDIKVTKDGIDAPCFRLTATHLEEIYTAFKSLN